MSTTKFSPDIKYGVSFWEIHSLADEAFNSEMYNNLHTRPLVLFYIHYIHFIVFAFGFPWKPMPHVLLTTFP